MEASDVYTNPPRSSYMTSRIFTHPYDGSGIKAIALDESLGPFLFAAFTILVQLIFMGIWNLVTEIVVAFYPARGRANILGLVVFYNSKEAWSAIPASFSYLVGLISLNSEWKAQHPAGRRYATRGTFLRAAGLLLLSVLVAGAGLAVSIKYLELLQLPGAAPVEPSAVFIPFREVYNIVDTLKLTSLHRSATMRALGSAEATELNTHRPLVNVSHVTSGDDARTDYSYQVTAANFGLQTNLGLKLMVQGSCRTEYSWIHPDNNGTANFYWIFGNSSTAMPQPGPRYPGLAYLNFNSFPDPNNPPALGKLNHTFSLFPETSCVLSTTPSNDPWYKTERLADVYKNLPPNIRDSPPMTKVDYRIRPGRPALACWEDFRFCDGSDCRSLSAWEGRIPKGVLYVLGFHFTIPKLQHIALTSAANALRIGFGSSRNSLVDAGAGSLQKDMERLVLASYLASKEAFRDITLFDRDSGFTNAALDGTAQLLPGAADFIIRTNSVITLRLDLVIVAPVLAASLGALSLLIRWLRKHAGGSWTSFKTRARAIGAPQLFRMLDERAGGGPNWERELHGVPVPADPWTQPEPSLGYEGHGLRVRPLIKYGSDQYQNVQQVAVLDRSYHTDSEGVHTEQRAFLPSTTPPYSAVETPPTDASTASCIDAGRQASAEPSIYLANNASSQGG